MKRLKSIFSALYFTYLGISLLLFIFRNSLNQWLDADFLLRFINFWLILGFVFFVTVWIIQAIQINFLKKDVEELEAKVLELKSKLYDFSRIPQTEEPKKPGTLDSPQ
jgi:uncharacterized membrane protein (DUF485 family)